MREEELSEPNPFFGIRNDLEKVADELIKEEAEELKIKLEKEAEELKLKLEKEAKKLANKLEQAQTILIEDTNNRLKEIPPHDLLSSGTISFISEAFAWFLNEDKSLGIKRKIARLGAYGESCWRIEGEFSERDRFGGGDCISPDTTLIAHEVDTRYARKPYVQILRNNNKTKKRLDLRINSMPAHESLVSRRLDLPPHYPEVEYSVNIHPLFFVEIWGSTILVADYSGSILFWDMKNGSLIKTIETGSEEEIVAARLSPDNSILCTLELAGEVNLWDISTGVHLMTLEDYYSGDGIVFQKAGFEFNNSKLDVIFSKIKGFLSGERFKFATKDGIEFTITWHGTIEESEVGEAAEETTGKDCPICMAVYASDAAACRVCTFTFK